VSPFDLRLNTSSSSSTTDSTAIENVVCDSGVIVGDVVQMIAGTAQKAQADSFANSKFIGIVESKPTATTAKIRVSGVSAAVYVGLTPNEEYFLSPTTPGGLVLSSSISGDAYRVRVGQAFSATQLIINKGITQQT
jgi:hypothetical protein